jgi:transposase InsO family protein
MNGGSGPTTRALGPEKTRSLPNRSAKFTNRVVALTGPPDCMPSFVSGDAITAASESIASGASWDSAVARSGVTGPKRPRARMRNRSLPIGWPNCRKQVDLIKCGESDITYLPTEEGWLYLAVIMDLYSRRIIGWAFAHHLGTELVAAALAMALVHRQPPQGLVHHSDRGVQYASAAYRQLLKAHGVIASMSRKGCCYDNAAAEAFFSTLKVECVYSDPL